MTKTSSVSCCSIIVLCHNREDRVRETLAYLKNQTFDLGVEVILVDNASTDRTKSIIEELLVDWVGATVVWCPTNVGIAEGRNMGWRAASKDYVISIDDDILISRTTIERLIVVAQSMPGFGVLSPTILDSKTEFALNGRTDDGSKVITFHEACFLIHKSMLSVVGCMDEMLTTAGEGLDFSIRLRRKKFQIIRLFDVVVYHFDRPRSATENKPRRLAWVWSFARVYWKNYSPLLAFFLTTKNFVAHARHGLLMFGYSYLLLLYKESVLGAVSGRRSRRKPCLQ